MSRRMQTFFASAQSSEILTHMNSLYGYDRAPDDTDQNSTAGISLAFKMHGNTMPAMLRGSVPGIAGLPGAFAQTHTSSLVRDTGSWMLSSLNAVASMPPAGALHNKQRFPATVGEISDVADPALESTVQVAQWLRDLEQAMHLLKYTSTDVVGVELGGFDTHVNQIPTHQRLLGALAFGMRSVFQDTPANIDLLTMVVSEFGRQIVQNGNPQPGTDHGIGGCFIAMGSGVRSGVYNMGISGFGHAWKPLADTASGNVPVSNPYWNAVVPAASWFALVRELLSKHFGASQADLDYILRTGSRRDLADRYTWEINYLV